MPRVTGFLNILPPKRDRWVAGSVDPGFGVDEGGNPAQGFNPDSPDHGFNPGQPDHGFNPDHPDQGGPGGPNRPGRPPHPGTRPPGSGWDGRPDHPSHRLPWAGRPRPEWPPGPDRSELGHRRPDRYAGSPDSYPGRSGPRSARRRAAWSSDSAGRWAPDAARPPARPDLASIAAARCADRQAQVPDLDSGRRLALRVV